MSPEKWLEVKEIFNAALDLPSAERRIFLEKTCPDAALRREVEILLDSADEAGNFIESPALTRVAHFFTEEKPPSYIGRQIGAYEIEREIGKGGMGAVFLARRADAEFDKKVAIKLIKRGFDTDEIIKRFRHERQILAALEHPNITRLIDGGSTDDGLPYLVMDYVEGLPLTKFCAAHQVSLPGRLDIFLKICSAVTYAHQNLIIHRDLKPSNILVCDDGTPKLLDFGIAKLIAAEESATLHTVQTNLRMMTPEYASPEQVGGRPVTTASDIYSLGVLLYELLTGQRPFRIGSHRADEISRILTDSAPTRPSESLRKGEEEERRTSDPESRKIASNSSSTALLPYSSSALRGDLDNIILMAMRKEPARRYSSVEQFAADIRRYLSGMPVIAREDSFGYRAEKFITRNKAGVAAGLGIAVSLVGGLIATSRQAKIARRQRDRALRETEKAEQINQFLQKMLASADPREQGKDVKVMEVLGAAAARIEKDFTGQPELTADLHTTIGTTYLNLGLLDAAENHLQKALNLRLEYFPRRSPEVAASLSNAGRIWQQKGDLKTAKQLFLEALQTFRRLKMDAEVARVLSDLGYLLALESKYREAVAAHSEELAIRRALFGENHPDVAKTLGSLAKVFDLLGESRKTESLHRQALGILQHFYPEGHPDVIMEISRLASAVIWRDAAEAEALFRKVLDLRRRYLGENHPDVAWAIYNLAFLNAERGDFVDAERLAREALAVCGRNLADEHPVTASLFLLLGRSLLAQGKAAPAKPAIEKCLALRRKTLGENHWLLASANSFYGECLMLTGEPERGARLLFESYERLLEKLGADHVQTRGARARLERFFPGS